MPPKKKGARRARRKDLSALIDIEAIIAALEAHILRQSDEGMTTAQVNAALLLLKKALPDAPAASSGGDPDDAPRKLTHEEALDELI